MSIKGEIIDQPCYEDKNGARGEGHKNCALACAKRGSQMAIIDESNTVYSITGDYAANKNEKLIPYVASMVEAKGTVTEKDGKKWIEVSLDQACGNEINSLRINRSRIEGPEVT